MAVFKTCGHIGTLERSADVEHFAGSGSIHGRYTLCSKEQKNNKSTLLIAPEMNTRERHYIAF